MLARARLLLVTLWAGSLWAIGYVAAPTLFAHVDKVQAGSMAGALLRSEAWLSLVVGALVMLLLALAPELEPKQRRVLRLIVAAMLACTLVNYLGLWPVMAEARAAGEKARFGMLHGISMLVYLVQSVLAVFLVLKNTAPRK